MCAPVLDLDTVGDKNRGKLYTSCGGNIRVLCSVTYQCCKSRRLNSKMYLLVNPKEIVTSFLNICIAENYIGSNHYSYCIMCHVCKYNCT